METSKGKKKKKKSMKFKKIQELFKIYRKDALHVETAQVPHALILRLHGHLVAKTPAREERERHLFRALPQHLQTKSCAVLQGGQERCSPASDSHHLQLLH